MPDEHAPLETDVSESDANASGPEGLAGGMGISSERVQEPHDAREGTAPDESAASVEGTGSLDSTVGSTNSATPVDPAGHEADPAAVPGDESHPDELAAQDKHPFDPERGPGHSHG